MNEHGTSLFYFKMYFPLRSATFRENFSRDRGIKEPFREALTLHRGRLLSCTVHDMMCHVYNYIIIDSKGR